MQNRQRIFWMFYIERTYINSQKVLYIKDFFFCTLVSAKGELNKFEKVKSKIYSKSG